jgi:hypothetical protein
MPQKLFQVKSLKIKVMKKINIIIIILLSIFCINCRQTNCPAFPPELNYFPYYDGQELKFTDSHNNIQSFVISNRESSEEFSFDHNCKCVCEAYSSFKTNENQDSLRLECNLNISGGRYDNIMASSAILNCRFQFSSRYHDNLSEELLMDKQIPYHELSKYLNDTIFLEEKNGKIVNNAIIVKNKGLVSYTTLDGEEWKLVE